MPATGDQALRFWVDRDTETGWDHCFVEAHGVGLTDWTTLPEQSGVTSGDTGASCPFWSDLHPFLSHDQTDDGDGSCAPSGPTGVWNAVSGSSGGYEQMDGRPEPVRRLRRGGLAHLRERRHGPDERRVHRRHLTG